MRSIRLPLSVFCGIPLALLALQVSALPVRGAGMSFEVLPLHQPPAGWLATQSGQGAAIWQIAAATNAPSGQQVLKQSGVAAFPVCLLESPRLRDGRVEVKFNAVSGKEDQAAGLVWRAHDASNYYVARANALEDNIRIYHMKDGKRTQFKSVDQKVSAGVWHSLRVDFDGAKFAVSFDGAVVLSAEDATFADSGMVGVWTKADSVTLFDGFRFEGQ